LKDIHAYQIKLHGLVAENELKAIGMLQILDTQLEQTNTILSISTDQSGLMGFLRQLHDRGLILLAVQCEELTIGS
jgi:hypothetical protein